MDTLGIIRQLEADPALRAQLRAVLLSEELLNMPQRLETFQARTEARLEELAAAQARTEARLEELAAAQARTDETLAAVQMALATLTERVGRLEYGQQRLEEAQEKTTRQLDALSRDFGRFSQLIGGTIEEDAVSLVETVLTGRGWVFSTPPAAVQLDGELDVLARAEDDEGRPVTVLAEAKVRLRPADVRRFAGALGHLLQEAGASGDYVGYVYGLRLYPGSVDAAREAGLGVLHWSGEKLAPERRLVPG